MIKLYIMRGMPFIKASKLGSKVRLKYYWRDMNNKNEVRKMNLKKNEESRIEI